MRAFLTSPFGLRVLLSIGIAIALGTGYWMVRHGGYVACERDHKAAYTENLERAIKQAQDIAKQDAEITEYYIKTRTKTIVTQIPVEITNAPITSDCTIGPDGLRLINDARALSADANPKGATGGMLSAPANPDGGIEGLGIPFVPNVPQLRRLQGEAKGAGGSGETSAI